MTRLRKLIDKIYFNLGGNDLSFILQAITRASLTPDQEKALVLRRRDGPLTVDEQKLVNDQRDAQLDRAIDALKSVMIYTQNAGNSEPGN